MVYIICKRDWQKCSNLTTLYRNKYAQTFGEFGKVFITTCKNAFFRPCLIKKELKNVARFVRGCLCVVFVTSDQPIVTL